MRRLSHIGSDHFPIYVILQTEQIFEQIHEELSETADDTKEAQLAIQEGIHKAEKERST